MMVSSRQTAEERRTTVLAAAVSEFARSGYAGTSTEAIANRAGISQPYLFRLFGTKKDLFLATYEVVSGQIVREMRRASEGLEGEEALEAMGLAYIMLMQDPEVLEVELHGFAAAPGDADIAEACRGTFEVLWEMVEERTGLPEERLREFFAMGMMINVMSAIDLLSVSERWAQSFCPMPEKVAAIQQAIASVKAARHAEAVRNEEVPA
jgi:AcrR family transcriptional regulator